MCCIYGVGLRVEIDRGARRRDEVADDDVRYYYGHFALLGRLWLCSLWQWVIDCKEQACKFCNAVVEMTE